MTEAAPPPFRDERPTHALNEQEKSWTATKFMVLMVVTLIVSIAVIVGAANASYVGQPLIPGMGL